MEVHAEPAEERTERCMEAWAGSVEDSSSDGSAPGGNC